MDAAAYSKQFYERLGELSRASGMKYSKNSFCAYQRLGDVFWSAHFLCGFFLRDGQLEVTVFSQVKPLDFDIVQFSVIDPKETHRVTDAQRVNAAFAARGLLIGKTVYRLAHLCGKDWEAAERCFRLAGETGRYEQKSLGGPGRYLHLVFIDYCKAMRAGVAWSEELSENGFPG